MTAKTFGVKRENKPGIYVAGFPANGHSPFINLKFGDSGQGGEFQVLLYMPDAHALVAALANAISHAEPRAAEAADLGLMDEAA